MNRVKDLIVALSEYTGYGENHIVAAFRKSEQTKPDGTVFVELLDVERHIGLPSGFFGAVMAENAEVAVTAYNYK